MSYRCAVVPSCQKMCEGWKRGGGDMGEGSSGKGNWKAPALLVWITSVRDTRTVATLTAVLRWWAFGMFEDVCDMTHYCCLHETGLRTERQLKLT